MEEALILSLSLYVFGYFWILYYIFSNLALIFLLSNIRIDFRPTGLVKVHKQYICTPRVLGIENHLLAACVTSTLIIGALSASPENSSDNKTSFFDLIYWCMPLVKKI